MCRNPMFAEQWLDHNLDRKPKFIGSAKNYTIEMKRNLEEVVRRKGKKLLIIQCGQCRDCRLQKSREWATRCMLETKEHEHNYFLTLTYDNEHLPLAQEINPETGELIDKWNGTLYPKDLEKFWKRVRSYYKRKYGIKGIRYYECGEYGSEEYTHRPHYHAIAFGLPIFDLKYHHKSDSGENVYVSETIRKLWGKGNIGVGDTTWESCAYTARYIMKKQTGLGKEVYKIKNILPEFCNMSRRPGIGKKYFEKNWQKIYNTDEIWIKTKKGAVAVKPSKYYDKLYDEIDHTKLEDIKHKRIVTNEIRQLQLENSTDKDWADVIKDQEEGKDIKIKALKRSFERGYI